jgi:mannose-6-phosphate isomerase-like protein (cupin superfamily)/ketosteroid isomerase-like protein
VLAQTTTPVAVLKTRAHNPSHKAASSGSPTPLILQEGDGDHLVHRAGPLGGVPFLIKVDRQFGNSEDFFAFAETLQPGQTIPFHEHHNSEEILLFEESGAKVTVGERIGNAGPHSLIFIPRNTWISATNTSSSPIHLLAIFSRRGFEDYMRAISAKPGETLQPLSQSELARLRTLGHATYWDNSNGPNPPGVAHDTSGTVTALNMGAPIPTESSGAEAELRAFMAELRRASVEGDVDAVTNSMAEDYVQTDINGYRQDKTTWLNEYFRPLAGLIKAGKFRWDEYERKNLQFRFYGDCAVVTGELQAKGTGARFGPQHTWVRDPNETFSGTLHFTHVYIKRNGNWMLVALHNQMPLAPANAAN